MALPYCGMISVPMAPVFSWAFLFFVLERCQLSPLTLLLSSENECSTVADHISRHLLHTLLLFHGVASNLLRRMQPRCKQAPHFLALQIDEKRCNTAHLAVCLGRRFVIMLS
ncbi:hypothetical protein QBC32DRAFT_342965 [Pseudoneurospora amorphoporcata]|uniref:Uncharacterized protein n=1 Tax=Pseudoneurospora amorphoporcata TaxID=241081 RepID=A0AAN6NU16_9PEZI|nr:hypothetical protein QBC32DRAFT_342965 [Pseudoneurospora amorphoporcata]